MLDHWGIVQGFHSITDPLHGAIQLTAEAPEAHFFFRNAIHISSIELDPSGFGFDLQELSLTPGIKLNSCEAN